MKATKVLTLLFVCMVNVLLAESVVSGERPLKVIAQNSGIITLQLQVPELQIENTGTGEFKALNMDDAGFTAETGYPELPVFSTWIAFPPKGDIEVKVTSGDYLIKKG